MKIQNNLIKLEIEFASEEAKRLYNGKLEYATNGSSGFDLRAYSVDKVFEKCAVAHNLEKKDDKPDAIVGYTLLSGQRTLIKTGIKIKIPNPNYEIQIRPRSGLALKHGISIVNSPGTIDSDFTQEIGIILINHSNEAFTFELGDKISQAVLCPILKAEFAYVELIQGTNRGGFGSTGVK